MPGRTSGLPTSMHSRTQCIDNGRYTIHTYMQTERGRARTSTCSITWCQCTLNPTNDCHSQSHPPVLRTVTRGWLEGALPALVPCLCQPSILHRSPGPDSERMSMLTNSASSPLTNSRNTQLLVPNPGEFSCWLDWASFSVALLPQTLPNNYSLSSSVDLPVLTAHINGILHCALGLVFFLLP